MDEPNLHQLVFQAAKEILAEGKYPTIDLICQRLRLNPQEISDVIDIQPFSDDSDNIPASEVEILEVLTFNESLKRRANRKK